jgi:hypothetical protein
MSEFLNGLKAALVREGWTVRNSMDSKVITDRDPGDEHVEPSRWIEARK